jgi:hypothetical protein
MQLVNFPVLSTAYMWTIWTADCIHPLISKQAVRGSTPCLRPKAFYTFFWSLEIYKANPGLLRSSTNHRTKTPLSYPAVQSVTHRQYPCKDRSPGPMKSSLTKQKPKHRFTVGLHKILKLIAIWCLILPVVSTGEGCPMTYDIDSICVFYCGIGICFW